MLCASDSRGFLSQAILNFKFQLIQIMSCSYLELCGGYQTDPGKYENKSAVFAEASFIRLVIEEGVHSQPSTLSLFFLVSSSSNSVWEKILSGELNKICPNETCWSQMHKMILS